MSPAVLVPDSRQQSHEPYSQVQGTGRFPSRGRQKWVTFQGVEIDELEEGEEPGDR